MARPWFKFFGGKYLADAKIGSLSLAQRSCWITLLCMASQTEDGIIQFLTVDTLLLMSGVDPSSQDWDINTHSSVDNVLSLFETMEMIVRPDPNTIMLTNWEDRQNSYLTDTEKKRNYRGKQEKTKKVDIVHSVPSDKSTPNRIEKNRKEENILERETPSQKAHQFFDNPEPTITELVTKGLQEQAVRREINKFISYWTELNKSGTKQRWQTEKTFEVNRRLGTWFSRATDFAAPTKTINLDNL